MALHFETFIENLKSCPILLVYGQSGSGKTTALSCALSLLGAENFRLFMTYHLQSKIQLCSATNIPLGLHDSDTKGGFSK